MNKSVLIVICDFLVLSLLAIVRFDSIDPTGMASQQSQTNSPPSQPQISSVAATNETSIRKDLVEVLSSALQEERQSRERLDEELGSARKALQTREQLLAERERRIREFQSSLQEKEAQTRRLEQERLALTRQFSTTQTNLQKLQTELASTINEAQTSKERLQAIQTDLRHRQEEATRLTQKIAEVEKHRQATEAEKQQLAGQLQVSESEKRIVREQVENLRGEVQTVRTEKARLQEHATKLAEGVTTLAEKSGELTKEIRENRPLAANTIFSEFITNRIQADFQAVRRGLLGREVSREKVTKTVLITDGATTNAIYHVQETPLTFADPGTDWDWLTGNLRRRSTVVPVHHVSFLSTDPRVVVVPVNGAEARLLGSRVYPVASDPFKFSDAVVVGADEGYYGESKFHLDPELPNYLKMDRSTLRGLFGKFNPSRGDLVFSKNGELLGIMVNNEYCALVRNFTPVRTIRLGIDVSTQQTGQMLAQMRGWVDRLPLKLQ